MSVYILWNLCPSQGQQHPSGIYRGVRFEVDMDSWSSGRRSCEFRVCIKFGNLSEPYCYRGAGGWDKAVDHLRDAIRETLDATRTALPPKPSEAEPYEGHMSTALRTEYGRLSDVQARCDARCGPAQAACGLARVERETIKKRLDELWEIIDRALAGAKQRGKAQRDPRVDLLPGDIVRIPWKEAMQFRLVDGVIEGGAEMDGGGSVIWTKPDGSGGNVLALSSWRKLCRDGTVLRAGPE